MSAGPRDDPPDSSVPESGDHRTLPRREWAWDAGVALFLAALAWWLPALALRLHPARIVVNFGPNDSAYTQGFRSDWERDGRSRFRWTTPAASVRLPLRVEGEGLRLRMRVRRHLLEPAYVRITLDGRTVDAFEIHADERVAYRTLDVPLPRLEAKRPLTLLIECESTSPRPLCLAMDWMEIISERKDTVIHLSNHFRVALLLLILAAFVAPRLAGTGRVLAGAHASMLLAVVSIAATVDVLAVDRIVREGWGFYVVLGMGCVVLTRWSRSRSWLCITSRFEAGVLTIGALVAVALRLALVLHPQFYYPDVTIHAVFAGRLAGGGLSSFLSEFTANQYRYSLGLQLENGHWYAFPYPPGFYLLGWPLIRWLGYRPEVAVSALPALVNSLEALLVFAVARRFNAASRVALAAAAGAHSLLPVFLVRLGLGYFPALVGHTMDLLVLLFVLSRLPRLQERRVVAALAGLIALALLTYTQSVLNLGIILPLFLLLQVIRDREPGAGARQAGLAAGGVLGVVLAMAVFYGRYLPVFLDMQRGVPMAEERILLEKQAQAPASNEEVDADDADPYAGPSLDLIRGARKAASRLIIFYGAFAPLTVAGVLLCFWGLGGSEARLLAVWGATYLILNLASGGLPGPNLVRYNKDLEVVAPLCCLGLARFGFWLWDRARPLGVVYASAYAAFGFARAVRALTEKIVFERS